MVARGASAPSRVMLNLEMKRSDKQKPAPGKLAARSVVALSAMAVGAGIGAALDRLLARESQPARAAPGTDAPSGPAFEERDADPVMLAKIGAGLVVAVGLVVLSMILLQFLWMGYAVPFIPRAPGLEAPARVTLPAQPRFEAVPGAAYGELHAREMEQLKSYGWVNQPAGVVHIPIDRAIELLVQRGLPVAPQDANNNFDTLGNELPSDSSSGRVPERVLP